MTRPECEVEQDISSQQKETFESADPHHVPEESPAAEHRQEPVSEGPHSSEGAKRVKEKCRTAPRKPLAPPPTLPHLPMHYQTAQERSPGESWQETEYMHYM
ncbi:hypothetical protein KUCAC02_028389 [Chaenocephalus aceratus]|uniref:Uncharacterized protein n=1 Tax=Chaenocephalus aceratus TaxID=36190 RepID=A0ACB9X2A6_CHAAC|nr:hypothetical protein KUCAC02_028389 [Chaenocephalus aceratus]